MLQQNLKPYPEPCVFNFVVFQRPLLILLSCSFGLSLWANAAESTFFVDSDDPRFVGFSLGNVQTANGPHLFCPFGSSGIYVDESTHILRGSSSTSCFTAIPGGDNCAITATMSGPNVSVSGGGSGSGGQNPDVILTSSAYLPNSQYCINASHSSPDGACASSACLMTPPERVSSITYETLQTDDLTIDLNPNAGGGFRLFPDDKVPDDPLDRRKIRVKAQFNETKAGVRIYFRSFDPDDPSTNAVPVDANDASGNTGNDNNGTVDASPASRSGLLSIPVANPANPYDCQIFTSGSVTGLSCLTDSTGLATVNFTTTMQPGDNFTVAASPNQAYLVGLTPATDGLNLKDTGNIQTPVTTTANNNCASSSVVACRADMLTVWRRLHIEVDSMDTVGDGNRVAGNIVAYGQAQDSGCNPPPPNPIPIPTPSPQPTPCYPTIAGFNVSTDNGEPLDVSRFQNGRILIGKRTFGVLDNSGTSVYLRGVPPLAGKIKIPSDFILFDDDDYNANDALVDGDDNETIDRLPESFAHVTSNEGTDGDGNPLNVFAKAYIRPEYDWAESANYNQSNLAIPLNVSESTVPNLISLNRNTAEFERNEFWISYILVAYQGDIGKDADGEDQAGSGISPAVPTTYLCDCYRATTCTGTSCTSLPIGGQGALVYQEVMQDSKRTFLQRANLSIKLIGTTVPHEIGHQFGLMGDNRDPITHVPNRLSATYKIMDYPNRPTQSDEFEFHPEHLNLLRRRVRSPGQ